MGNSCGRGNGSGGQGKGKIKKVPPPAAIIGKTDKKDGSGSGSQIQVTQGSSSSKDLRSKVMNNGMIVDKIAEKSPACVLLTLRRTCSLWNHSFIPKIRKKHGPISLASSCGKESGGREDILKVIRSSSEVPFTSYRFCPDVTAITNDSAYRDQVLATTFIADYGSTIKTLHLSTSPQSIMSLTLSQLRQIIFEWTPQLVELSLETPLSLPTGEGDGWKLIKRRSLPNLKRFKMHLQFQHEAQSPVRPGFILLVADVLECTEGRMEYLDLHDSGLLFQRASNNYNGPAFLELVRWTVWTLGHRLHKLKTLKPSKETIHTDVDLKLLVSLAEGTELKADVDVLQLNSLSIGLAHNHHRNLSTSFPLLRSLLVTQSSSLTELELTLILQIDFPTSWRLPRMENVRKLKLFTQYQMLEAQLQPTAGEDYGEAKANELDSFMDIFPQLKQFSYNFDPIDLLSDEDDFLPFPFMGRIFHPRVTDLETSARNSYQLERIHSMFPSLTRLKLYIYHRKSNNGEGPVEDSKLKDFVKIWTLWPTLTVLHLLVENIWGSEDVTHSTELDSFVSGVPKAGLKRLRRKMNPKKKCWACCKSESFRKMVVKRKTCPGIGDLKYLQEFMIAFHTNVNHRPPLPQLAEARGCGSFIRTFASSTLQRLVIQKHRQDGEFSEHSIQMKVWKAATH